MLRIAVSIIFLVAVVDGADANCTNQAAISKCAQEQLEKENVVLPGGYISNVGDKKKKAADLCQAECGINPSRFADRYGSQPTTSGPQNKPTQIAK